MDFCCCINVVFPVPVPLAAVLTDDVFSLLFTQSFSSPDRPGDRLGERLVRLPGLRLFLKRKKNRQIRLQFNFLKDFFQTPEGFHSYILIGE